MRKRLYISGRWVDGCGGGGDDIVAGTCDLIALLTCHDDHVHGFAEV